MVPLDRSSVTVPRDWQARVERAWGNYRLFVRKARAFERLVLNGNVRRAGFRAYAPQVFGGDDFPAVWRHDALKDALVTMTDGHCAYCQSAVDDNSYGPVEHVKPKSLFPLLAYEIANYLLSCQRCNLAKLDRWPATGGYVRPDDGSDPRARFTFTKHGRVKAAPGDADAEVTIKDFRLNRKGLKKNRRLAINKALSMLRPILDIPGLTEAQRRELAKPHVAEQLTRFSEAINQNVRRAWESAFPGVPL